MARKTVDFKLKRLVLECYAQAPCPKNAGELSMQLGEEFAAVQPVVKELELEGRLRAVDMPLPETIPEGEQAYRLIV